MDIAVTRYRSALFLLLFLTLFAVWQSTHLDNFAFDYDEGVYLSEARLIRAGERLYTDVRSSSPPLFIWGLVATFGVAGEEGVWPARLAIVLTGLVGLIAVARITHGLAARSGIGAGAGAAVLMAAFPLWYLYSRVAMADIPSLSVSLIALALGLQSWVDGRRLWFALAGIAAAVALLIKLVALYTFPILLLLALLRHRESRSGALNAIGRDVLGFGLGAVIPILLVLPWVDLPAAYETAVQYHLDATQVWTSRLRPLRVMVTFVGVHAGWVVLALMGVLWLYRRQALRAWRSLILLLVWPALVALMFVQHAPLWEHLLLPLVPPAAVAGGIAMAEASGALVEWWRVRRLHNGWLTIATGITIVGAVLAWPAARRHDQALLVPPSHVLHLETDIIPWLTKHVPPDEPIISDEPMIVFRAGRRVPATLADTSYTRIASGFLTAEELIEAAERTRPAAIIFWRDRFTLLPDWLAWVRANYVLRCELGPERLIYLRPDIATPRGRAGMC